MANSGKRNVPNQHYFDIIEEDTPDLVLIVDAFTPMSKPLNGPVQQGCYMPKLQEYPVNYLGTRKKKGSDQTEQVPKTKKLPVKQLKPSSFKGILHHSALRVCRKAGMEVCHSTDKLRDKEGNKLLPKGFHPLGWCVPKLRKQAVTNKTKRERGELDALMTSFTSIDQSCIIHQIFGSMHYASRLPIFIKPIIKELPASVEEKERARLLNRFQVGHFATEDRNVLTYEGKSAQNFREEYYSGSFEVLVYVDQLQPHQLGLILNALRIMKKLGRGYTAGYGRLYVDGFYCVKRKEICHEEFDNHRVRFHYEYVDEPQPGIMEEALLRWQEYRAQFDCKA